MSRTGVGETASPGGDIPHGPTMKNIVVTGVFACLALGSSAAEPRTFVVNSGESALTIQVGKAGLFKFAGHEHEVVATGFSGQVVADAERIDNSSVVLSFETQGLSVSEKDEPAGDAPKVQEKMRGPDVLDVIRFPQIRFQSRLVSGKETGPGLYDLDITGDLSLKGVTRPLALKVRVEIKGQGLIATGTVNVRQTDFGMRPVSVGGVVKVKDELAITYRIVAQASLQPSR